MSLFLFLLFLFPFDSATSGQNVPFNYGQANNSVRYLSWQAHTPLNWNNFKGKPEQGDVIHAAVTYAGFDLKVEKIHLLTGEVTFRTVAIFDQHLSWVKAEKKDSQLLAHEQLHFDIAELYARKLEKKLNSLKLSKKDKKTILRWQQHFSKAQLALQQQYDEETLHGIRTHEQQAWRKSLDQQLRISRNEYPLNGSSLASKN